MSANIEQIKTMLKEAVEGEVCILGGAAYVKEKNNGSLKQYILDNFKNGDKVKLIIIPEGMCWDDFIKAMEDEK